MIWSKAMKYPVLIMGILMFVIFVGDNKTHEWWNKAKRRFIPSTCDSLVTRLTPKVPESWKMSCPTIDLLIMRYDLGAQIFNKSSRDKLRIKMYKQAANLLVQFSKMANPETLEVLQDFKLIIESDKLELLSHTDGEALVAFRKMKSKKRIAEHLKLTVKVKEIIK